MSDAPNDDLRRDILDGVSSDPSATGSASGGGLPPTAVPATVRSAREREKRLGLWVGIVAPVVVLWFLLLFAPAGSWMPIGQRVAVGFVATGVVAPIMWLRSGY